MKRVLITGAGSYVGTHVMRRLQEELDRFEVRELDVKGDEWREFNFSGYDSVFHVAGIAHVSTDPSMEPLYMAVNRDLAIEVAERAKAAGVKQLVFMSSSIVYGDSTAEDKGPITRDTLPAPSNFYGRSKLEAEEGLTKLADGRFSVAILRCPMIYGPGCKGNFPTLAKIAGSFPVFPKVRNRRSILYIDNLSEFVAMLVSSGEGGVYFPQNEEYMATSDVVVRLGKLQGRKVRLSGVLGAVAAFACRHVDQARKAFGSLYYDQAISSYDFDYRVVTLDDSLKAYCQGLGERR